LRIDLGSAALSIYGASGDVGRRVSRRRWDNGGMSAQHTGHHRLTLNSPQRRLVMWLVLSVFAALLAWFGFRGYFNPELLFHFANGLYC
jgi:hypothetical protein